LWSNISQTYRCEGIDKLTGIGVYYGASLVEPLQYKGQDVFIVGGANSAGQAAIHFSKHAKTVTLVVRANSLNEKMSQYLVNQLNETNNIKVLLNSIVSEVRGENRLEGITIANTQTGEQQNVPAAGLQIVILLGL
jgi:thioredoxin reductase (NADPH)